MSTFLSRFLSARRSKPASPLPVTVEKVEPQIVHHERANDEQVTPEASLDSPSQNVELDSKIHPDLSALFASVEDALKTAERAAEVKKRKHIYDDSESENEDDAQGETPDEQLTHDQVLYASFGSELGTGWPTFGQEMSASLDALDRSHIPNRHGPPISTNFGPSITDPVLSWSPKPVEGSESLRPSGRSVSTPALYSSPETQQNTQTSVYYSPTFGTFGFPSPAPFTPTDSPTFPPPAFHSTPKTSSSRYQSIRKRSRATTTRERLAGLGVPPLPSNLVRKRSKSEQPRPPRRMISGIVNERARRQRTLSRTPVKPSRIPARRKSAEWNAHAATAGVVADPKETTEFGWPAEVSREILRLSLGDDAMIRAQQQERPTRTITTEPEMAAAKLRNFKRDGPRVNHVSQTQSIRPGVVSDRRLSSAPHLRSSASQPAPSSTLPSYAPRRHARRQTVATELASITCAPVVARQKPSKSRSYSSDHILDAKSDAKTDAEVSVADHGRSESGDKIEWQSRELQEFISLNEDGEGVSLAALRSSTPMKKSESESTYETAGSSSFLHAPSLSVIAPTPRGSPNRSRTDSGVLPDVGDGLQVPTPPPQSDKSIGKRKAEESEDGSPPNLRESKSKKSALVAEGKPAVHRDSNASHAPSSFQSFQSQKSRKRVRLSSPMPTPDHSRPGSTVHPPLSSSVSSRGSSRSPVPTPHLQRLDSGTNSPARPTSRMSRASRTSRAMSTGASSGAGSVPFPKRRSLSQASIPISAIVSPRPPSIDRLSTFHMRDPKKPPPRRDVGWSLRFASHDEKGSPFMAWAFWCGFLFPLMWWVASFWRIPTTRMVGTDTEKAVVVDDPYYEREARAWRLRCRIASLVFFISYVPVIVLLAIFVPRS